MSNHDHHPFNAAPARPLSFWLFQGLTALIVVVAMIRMVVAPFNDPVLSLVIDLVGLG